MASWWSPSKPTRNLCGAPEKSFVRGIVLTPWELQRATLVKQDMKDDKWSSHVKVLELEVSTSYGRV